MLSLVTSLATLSPRGSLLSAWSLVLIEPHPRIANRAGTLLLVWGLCPAISVVRKEERHDSLVNLVGRSLWPGERELVARSVNEHREYLMRKRTHSVEKTLYSQVQVKNGSIGSRVSE